MSWWKVQGGSYPIGYRAPKQGLRVYHGTRLPGRVAHLEAELFKAGLSFRPAYRGRFPRGANALLPGAEFQSAGLALLPYLLHGWQRDSYSVSNYRFGSNHKSI